MERQGEADRQEKLDRQSKTGKLKLIDVPNHQKLTSWKLITGPPLSMSVTPMTARVRCMTRGRGTNPGREPAGASRVSTWSKAKYGSGKFNFGPI